MASTTDHSAGAAGGREVLAFDLYGTLVDPIAIAGELGRLLGDAGGREAAGLWRAKQLEYSFRLTAMGRYEDFRWVTARALGFALASLGARLPEGQAERLVGLYDHLRPFPDAVPALRALAGLGYELAVLSNGTPAMIGNCLDNSGLGEFFGQRISVDEVRVFKPSPVVYRHAAERLSVTGRAGPAGDEQRVRLCRGQRGGDAHGLGEPFRRPVRHDRRPAGPHRARARPPARGAGRLTPRRRAAEPAGNQAPAGAVLTSQMAPVSSPARRASSAAAECSGVIRAPSA